MLLYFLLLQLFFFSLFNFHFLILLFYQPSFLLVSWTNERTFFRLHERTLTFVELVVSVDSTVIASVELTINSAISFAIIFGLDFLRFSVLFDRLVLNFVNNFSLINSLFIKRLIQFLHINVNIIFMINIIMSIHIFNTFINIFLLIHFEVIHFLLMLINILTFQDLITTTAITLTIDTTTITSIILTLTIERTKIIDLFLSFDHNIF